MFLIGIFGIQDKQKEICNIEVDCKNCKNTQLKLYNSFRYFHIFFIPIYKWKNKYSVYCQNCGTIYDIPLEKGMSMDKENKCNISYWDLKEVHKGNIISRCSQCNSIVDEGFDYCPYCGKKLSR